MNEHKVLGLCLIATILCILQLVYPKIKGLPVYMKLFPITNIYTRVLRSIAGFIFSEKFLEYVITAIITALGVMWGIRETNQNTQQLNWQDTRSILIVARGGCAYNSSKIINYDMSSIEFTAKYQGEEAVLANYDDFGKYIVDIGNVLSSELIITNMNIKFYSAMAGCYRDINNMIDMINHSESKEALVTELIYLHNYLDYLVKLIDVIIENPYITNEQADRLLGQIDYPFVYESPE